MGNDVRFREGRHAGQIDRMPGRSTRFSSLASRRLRTTTRPSRWIGTGRVGHCASVTRYARAHLALRGIVRVPGGRGPTGGINTDRSLRSPLSPPCAVGPCPHFLVPGVSCLRCVVRLEWLSPRRADRRAQDHGLPRPCPPDRSAREMRPGESCTCKDGHQRHEPTDAINGRANDRGRIASPG